MSFFKEFQSICWELAEEPLKCPHCNEEICLNVNVNLEYCTHCQKHFDGSDPAYKMLYPLYTESEYDSEKLKPMGVSSDTPKKGLYELCFDPIATVGAFRSGDPIYVVLARHTQGNSFGVRSGYGQFLGLFSEKDKDQAEYLFHLMERLLNKSISSDDFENEFYQFAAKRVTQYGTDFRTDLNFMGYFEHPEGVEMYRFFLDKNSGMIKKFNKRY